MEEEKKVPNMVSIKCNGCGEFKKAGQPRLGKLLEKYGGIDKLRAEYKCMKCRPKPVKKVKEKKEEVVSENKPEEKVVSTETTKTTST